MPTFTAIALDTLIEPGAAKSMAPVRNSPDSGLWRRHNTPNSIPDMRMDTPSPKLERGVSVPPNNRMDTPSSKLERGVSVPPNPKLERGVSVPSSVEPQRGVIVPSNMKRDRRNGASTTTTPYVDKKHHWTQISPSLYATPVSTPLPDSPSSFPPSPYIINHKRRGPRLMKSFSEDDVATCKEATDEIKVDENGYAVEQEVVSVSTDERSVPGEVLNSTMDDNIRQSRLGDANKNYLNGTCSNEHRSNYVESGPAGENGVMKSVASNMQQDDEVDEFVDPQDSMSVKSITESEGYAGVERSLNATTPMAEYYDAWEELSSESGPQLPMPDIENELREIRLSLLMEMEKRKQAEETLNNVRNHWQKICEQSSLVGLTLPADLTTWTDGGQQADTAAELCQQVYLARFVSNSIGRGTAKAEVEMEMETQIKLKNSEIARLLDRLHYYEAVNQEMSQRNQEVVETARRLRQRRKRRQKWIWSSIATAVTLGSAVLAYSYFQSGKGSSSSSPSNAPMDDHEHN